MSGLMAVLTQVKNAVFRTVPVGTILESASVTPPDGWLRCGGGDLLKTGYPALFSAIGDTYSKQYIHINGHPWACQYEFNINQSNAITGWETSGNTPAVLSNSSHVVVNGRVHIFAGIVNGVLSRDVYSAVINADGTLGTFAVSGTRPSLWYNGYGTSCFVTKSRVYVTGGYSDGYTSSTVHYAPINTDGTLGAWVYANDFIGDRQNHMTIVTKGYVYIIGGTHYSSGSLSTTTYAPINADGSIGSWSAGTALPATIHLGSVIKTHNRVFILGGIVNGVTSNAIYTAVINADGTLGAWASYGNLPSNFSYTSAVVTNGRVYVIGGYNGTSYVGAVYSAAINVDGTIATTWRIDASLPSVLVSGRTFIVKDKIHIVGGTNGTNNLTTIMSASFTGGANTYTDKTTLGGDSTYFGLPLIQRSASPSQTIPIIKVQ